MKNLIHFVLCLTLLVAFRNEEIVKFVGRNAQWLSDVKELGLQRQ